MTIESPNPFVSLSDSYRGRSRPSGQSVKSAEPLGVDAARDTIANALKLKLPPPKTTYSYVILPLVSGKTTDGADTNFVLYPPEFLFVYDFGFSAHVGLTAIWKTDPFGKGDPNFPNFKPPIIWSISALDYSNLVYPDSPGELLFGLVDGTTLETVKDKLAAYGLSAFEELIPGVYVCKCPYFEELATCKRMTKELDFIKYAETNHNNRLIDFSPGWILKRLT